MLLMFQFTGSLPLSSTSLIEAVDTSKTFTPSSLFVPIGTPRWRTSASNLMGRRPEHLQLRGNVYWLRVRVADTAAGARQGRDPSLAAHLRCPASRRVDIDKQLEKVGDTLLGNIPDPRCSFELSSSSRRQTEF
jgi:hypothetical protein